MTEERWVLVPAPGCLLQGLDPAATWQLGAQNASNSSIHTPGQHCVLGTTTILRHDWVLGQAGPLTHTCTSRSCQPQSC
jgi:hypothetical protein